MATKLFIAETEENIMAKKKTAKKTAAKKSPAKKKTAKKKSKV